MDGLRALLAVVVLLSAQSAAAAWSAPETWIPDPREPAPGLQPLGDAPFGERIALSTGRVVFHQADIVLEGTGPTIRVARTRSMETHEGDPAAAFGDWRLDVPRIETRLASAGSAGLAWRIDAGVDAGSFARCSGFAAPHASDAAWEGYGLHLGDGVRHALLKRAPGWTLRPGLPGPFPAVTTSDVQVGCVSETRNGEPGEAFLGVAPDGVRYRFDWLVGAAAGVGRLRAAMFATRVEDRFGNWIDYAYDGARLHSILASDGRSVAFEWSGERIASITTHPGSDAPRTWRYEYNGAALSAVVLPDGSRWSFAVDGQAVAAITTPSGLTGRFVFEHRASRPSLVQRTWSGPGVDARWETSYGPEPGSVEVVGPGGARVRHVFSTGAGASEGTLLRRETFDVDGLLLRTERFGYAELARIGDAMRHPSVQDAREETRVALRERVISQQGRDFTWRVATDCDGLACFDAFGRPTAVERIGTHVRLERWATADHLDAWVLGQLASIQRIAADTGAMIEPVRIEYDAKSALPLRRFERGLLKETRTYYADGHLASRSDGRDTPGFDTTIRYAGWTRGLPTTVTFPGGVRRRAGVEVDGTIRWVASETGARTCFAYDSVGRRIRTTWPAETEPTRCGDDQWNETFESFEQVATATPLLAAGHWIRSERTGNGVRTTAHDALWRPVLIEEHDTADIANTRRGTRVAYDVAGRETFRSYASSLATLPITGVTTHHDALGRIVRTEQASELGPLVSTIEYLDGFRMRATNARGHATMVERLRAYDTPEDAWVESIAYAEGLHVDIERDAFDQPVRITHRNATGTVAATTRFVHDAHGRLCKTIAPDRGATVIGRDNAGNVTWTVAGSAFDDPVACQHAEAFADTRRVDRTWDARSRITTVAFPDGVGNQSHTYTADGLPNSISTWNVRAGRMVINTYAWNARRLLVRDALTHPGIDTWNLRIAHDRNGHPATLTYPNNTAVALAPDALGQPTRIGGYALGVRWHPDGTLAQFTYGNGITHTTTRNMRGLPQRRRDAAGSTVVLDETLDYDAAGNLAAITDDVAGALGSRVREHDGLDRLVHAEASSFGSATFVHDAVHGLAQLSIGGPHARTHHFCRDAAGRLTNVKTLDCASGPSVMGIAHDAAGNVERINGQAFAYDLGHRLRNVKAIESYEYDGLDKRVRADSSQGLGEILSQYDHAGRLMWQTNHRAGVGLLYLYLGARLVAVREQPMSVGSPAVTRYAHTDVEGTPVAETRHPDGTLLRRSTYEPFGLPTDGPAREGVGFRGMVSDAATGLLYGPEGHVHPMLPGRLGACGGQDTALFELPPLDATSLLRAPPRRPC